MGETIAGKNKKSEFDEQNKRSSAIETICRMVAEKKRLSDPSKRIDAMQEETVENPQ